MLVNFLDKLEGTFLDKLAGTKAGADRLKLISLISRALHIDASIMDCADMKSLRDELEEEGKEVQNLSVHSLRVWHDLIRTMKNMSDLGRTSVTTDV